MSAEWAEVIAWYGVPVLILAAGWFAHAVWDQPRRNATERALEAALAKQRATEQLYDGLRRVYAGCREQLATLTAHTMARHKARSEAAVRGHATRRGRGKASEGLAWPVIGPELEPR